MSDKMTARKKRHADYMRKWRAENSGRWGEIQRKANAKYRELHFEKDLEVKRNYLHGLRLAVHAFFGGKCVQCGNEDFRVLQLDHINGDGAKDNHRSWNIQRKYKYITLHPEEARARLQLLCCNCNWIKRWENKEYRRSKYV